MCQIIKKTPQLSHVIGIYNLGRAAPCLPLTSYSTSFVTQPLNLLVEFYDAERDGAIAKAVLSVLWLCLSVCLSIRLSCTLVIHA